MQNKIDMSVIHCFLMYLYLLNMTIPKERYQDYQYFFLFKIPKRASLPEYQYFRKRGKQHHVHDINMII